MKEVWKQIAGFDRYEVSTTGRVRGPGGEMKILKNTSGYAFVRLYPGNGGIAKNVYVGPLVMETFIGERPENMKVSFLDGNHMNCKLNNLAYETQSAVMRRSAFNSPPRKVSEATATEIADLYAQGESLNGIRTKLDLSLSSVRMRVTGGRGTAKKLSATIVANIRKQLAAGWSTKSVAALNGISTGCVYQIKLNKIWANQ